LLARFAIALPFDLAIPNDVEFSIYQYSCKGYVGHIYPPARALDRPTTTSLDEIRINGAPGSLTNALRIDFHRDNFAREPVLPAEDSQPTLASGPSLATLDPPIEVIREMVDDVVLRLRYVCGAAHIHTTDLDHQPFQIRYLNDDETELPEDGLMRVVGRRSLKVQYACVTPEMWSDAFTSGAVGPPWEMLLLDAREHSRDVGVALILAFTALEVLINHALAVLATMDGTKAALLKWMSGDYANEPNISDKFSAVFGIFSGGASLKSNATLWQRFVSLRKARNKYVHEGRLIVDQAEASALVAATREIIDWVRSQLPIAEQWQRFNYSVQFEASATLVEGRVTPPASAQVSSTESAPKASDTE
jgi:hypothetical protein